MPGAETTLEILAQFNAIGSLLRELSKWNARHLRHWKQGEFHHDLVIGFDTRPDGLPGDVIVVSTNCNGGVKEILCLGEIPERWALWNYRCPENPDFEGEMPPVLECVRTAFWFNPCELLADDARSEYAAPYRRRQRGGGWVPIDSDEE